MTTRLTALGCLLLLAGCQTTPPRAVYQKPELLEARKIWDAAPHNAFTDLIRFRGEWFCVFREGREHVSPDGAIQVLVSKDGRDWTSAARVTSPRGDLRDPKIIVTPRGQLRLIGAVALPQPAAHTHQTLTWFSTDGRNWSPEIPVGEPDSWMWRVTWQEGTAYGIGYDTTKAERSVRLYSSRDGIDFTTLVPELFTGGRPNETGLIFQPDGTALCLLRRDGPAANGQLGIAPPPYTAWEWKDVGARIGGPQMLRLPDGRIVAAVRLYEAPVRTSLAWVDPATGRLTEFLKLPSGGDTSYAGLVWHDGLLWVSYYSSHEGKTAIYLAKVGLPAA